MILFPFATQATEPAPGASIEEPRVPHTNLAAYPRCRPMGGLLKNSDEDFDLILDLIAHPLADDETSTIQAPHHQSVAKQKSKLVADFGLMMHLTWARQLLDNREFVLVEGRHPSSDPNHGRDDAGYDSEEEERDLHHQDMYMNGGRNHHFGPPPTQEG